MPIIIKEAGIYDIPEDEYHADPCVSPSLSSGVASKIVGGTLAEARHAHPRLNPAYESKDKTQFDLGSVAHALVLGAGPEIVPVYADDWRTKAAKEARDEILEAGKQPCLLAVYEKAQVMQAVLFEHLADDAENCGAFADGAGASEQSVIARIDIGHEGGTTPVWLRTKPDWHGTLPDGRNVIYDYKTWGQGCDPEAFMKYLYRENRDIQDPLYSMALASITGDAPADVVFRFIVQSANEPHLVSVIELDPQARDFSFARAEYALRKWAGATASGKWPGYLPRTHYGSAPNYEIMQWDGRMMAEEFAAQLDDRAAINKEEENV